MASLLKGQSTSLHSLLFFIIKRQEVRLHRIQLGRWIIKTASCLFVSIVFGGKPELLDAQTDYTVGPNTPVNLLKCWPLIMHTCSLRDGDRRTFGVYWQAGLVLLMSFRPMRDPVLKEVDDLLGITSLVCAHTHHT